MPKKRKEITNLPVPAKDSFGLLSGAYPLANEKWEAYARERSVLTSKLVAYRRAGFASTSDHDARGNAIKLERQHPEVGARIAYLTKQDEAVLAVKRQRLEEFLWAVHEGDIGDLWETVSVEKRDKKGAVVHGEDGKPIMVKRQQLKNLVDVPEETRRLIESLSVDEKGRLVAKTYSKLTANAELRKLLGVGVLSRDEGELHRLSDAELITQLAAQAKELGIEIDLSYRLGGQ